MITKYWTYFEHLHYKSWYKSVKHKMIYFGNPFSLNEKNLHLKIQRNSKQLQGFEHLNKFIMCLSDRKTKLVGCRNKSLIIYEINYQGYHNIFFCAVCRKWARVCAPDMCMCVKIYIYMCACVCLMGDLNAHQC